ncbi:MAG: 3'-5' exonuclease [Sinomicrobium sp.]|nr:3'-5' exonuclease [Sinomicrobium sp.]
MLQRINLENILFLDIETVPEAARFTDLNAEKRALWEEKSEYQRKEDYTAEEFYDRAGIWAEFGKIVCISAGYFSHKGNTRTFRVTSFYGDELKLLRNFKALLDDHFNHPNQLLCAHNGKEFDFPYIARRMIINELEIPQKLNLFGKKPWEVPHIDTMELWKFGDYKHFTSLKLLTHILHIPSPKTDIDGSMIRDVYYNDNDPERIKRYCEQDTVAVAQVLLRLRNEPILTEKEIVSV